MFEQDFGRLLDSDEADLQRGLCPEGVLLRHVLPHADGGFHDQCATYHLSPQVSTTSLPLSHQTHFCKSGLCCRVVPESQRSLALGLQWVFVRLLGTIPGPIIVGKIFDSTCLLWNESKACHASSFCLNNDIKKLGVYIFTYTIIPLSVGERTTSVSRSKV